MPFHMLSDTAEVCPETSGKIKTYLYIRDVLTDVGNVTFGSPQSYDIYQIDWDWIKGRGRDRPEAQANQRYMPTGFRITDLVCANHAKAKEAPHQKLARIAAPAKGFMSNAPNNQLTLSAAIDAYNDANAQNRTGGFLVLKKRQKDGQAGGTPIAFVLRTMQAWWALVDPEMSQGSDNWTIGVQKGEFLQFRWQNVDDYMAENPTQMFLAQVSSE